MIMWNLYERTAWIRIYRKCWKTTRLTSTSGASTEAPPSTWLLVPTTMNVHKYWSVHVQYDPWNILCCRLFCCGFIARSWWIILIYLPVHHQMLHFGPYVTFRTTLCHLLDYLTSLSDPRNTQEADVALFLENRPNSQIPECTCSISHNAPFRTEMYTLWDMEHVHSEICELGQLTI